MTTTFTLDPDLAKKVRALAYPRQLSFQRAWDEVIRLGLTSPVLQDPQPRYTLEPHPSGFRPGIDPGKLHQFVDQLEVEGFITKPQR